MDFYKIQERPIKTGKTEKIECYPDFKVCRSKDLMVRGKSFYAIWDESKGLWSTDEYDVARLIDEDLARYLEEAKNKYGNVSAKFLSNYSSKSWVEFKNYISRISDSSHELDTKLTFSNSLVKKEDYISKRLPYPIEDGECSAFNEIMSTLYSDEERRKLEWAIGSIIAGDSKKIQKFIVLYGDPGTGKSTVLDIIQSLFEGYYTIFEAKSLTSSSNVFSTEQFKTNPLVAIQHDGDLSKIEDNSKLNSIVSHEEIIINEKYKSSYPMKVNCFLFMATNKPVKITDAKAGLIRRLIDVRPSGNKIPIDRYFELKDAVQFELGKIAKHCLDVYLSMGKDYYNKYRPVDMMFKTDPFFNFVEDSYEIFSRQDGVTLKQAYSMYKQYCEETNADFKMQMYKFREELKNYFKEYYDYCRLDDGSQVRSYYVGFLEKKFERKEDINEKIEKKKTKGWIELKEQKSQFDILCSECKAQEATKNETPKSKWDLVQTKLKDINTSELHYVQVPENHIVIDFDIKDSNGEKSLDRNLEEANRFPKTYAEVSKSGSGVHLHYIYTGDVTQLSRLYGDNIEIKVFSGNSSLRRKLSKCNDIPINTISSGLPTKGVTKVVNFEAVKSEKALRALIIKNLRKEIHPATKPSIDFIVKILDDAYNSGMKYDVTDMRPDILVFASSSSHQSEYCIKALARMKFKSDEPTESIDGSYNENDIVFYDVEVFPNLFLVNWKKRGKENKVVRMINPRPDEIEALCKRKLVGFNNRRYDNHIMYARMMGYSNEQLFRLSQRIINTQKTELSNAYFSEAYNLSYADIYDYASKKQSLKKWEIELGIHHQELGLPWDQPVPEELWTKVAEYCDNDVIATEAVFEATKQDLKARQILADLSGLCVNDTTRSHATKIIFQGNKKPELNYTDLSKDFPGYKFENGKSTYRGEETGEGGYVFAIPGMYGNVALLDIASMHPTTIDVLNLFGPYTDNFRNIKSARLYVKHREIDKLTSLFDGKLLKYLGTDEEMDDLAFALKIVINSVYGYTCARFDNPFKDPRNKDNIVAKRGALFMINLKHEVEDRGFVVAHIKTDSIKIPDATPEIIQFVMDYGKKYGYNFEHEATYEKMCLVNDAVYIAKYDDNIIVNGKHSGQWTATGTQFAVPYVFKTLFSHEPIIFEDLCETFAVSSQLYLDMNENLPNVEELEDILRKREMIAKDPLSVSKKELERVTSFTMSDDDIMTEINSGHDYKFIGKVGRFCPIKPGFGGGILYREQNGKYYAPSGTKGYRWLESEQVKNLAKENDINIDYFRALVDDAFTSISSYGDAEWFMSDIKYSKDVPFVGGKIV